MINFKSKINNEKDESIELLKANTSRLNEIVDIMQESKRLEKFLNSKQKNLVCIIFSKLCILQLSLKLISFRVMENLVELAKKIRMNKNDYKL